MANHPFKRGILEFPGATNQMVVDDAQFPIESYHEHDLSNEDGG